MYIQRKIGQGHPYSKLTNTLSEIHPWYKFGPNTTNICWVIVLTSEIFMLKSTPMASYLTKTLLWYIHGISLGPMRLIFVELSCLQAKIVNIHVKIDPPWPRKIGKVLPSSNLTKTLLRYIHGMGPMRLIFVELSCLQMKIAYFHVKIDTHDLEK